MTYAIEIEAVGKVRCDTVDEAIALASRLGPSSIRQRPGSTFAHPHGTPSPYEIARSFLTLLAHSPTGAVRSKELLREFTHIRNPKGLGSVARHSRIIVSELGFVPETVFEHKRNSYWGHFFVKGPNVSDALDALVKKWFTNGALDAADVHPNEGCPDQVDRSYAERQQNEEKDNG